MSDSFQGNSVITVQPGDHSDSYTFTFAACSSATANDGSLPYGTTIASCVTTAYNEAGTDSTTLLVYTESLTTPVVTVGLKWPTTAGRYSLEFVITLSSGSVMEFDFTRIYALDISAAR